MTIKSSSSVSVERTTPRTVFGMRSVVELPEEVPRLVKLGEVEKDEVVLPPLEQVHREALLQREPALELALETQ